MKVLRGYLIDRETGSGIPDKAVAFTTLAGAAITTATTYAQSMSSVTGADGEFEAWFELSPGPVNIEVTVAADEVKVRKHDETAQVGAAWLSDLERIGRGVRNGVLDGFLNELAVTTPSGHNIVIATGGAIIDGILFSIENGPMTIAGTANTNPALNPRLDLVTLRQYHADAAGQDAGRQEVVVTLGTTQDTAPATPTGADFTDLPLAVVSTGYNAATKTVDTDLRKFTTGGDSAPLVGTTGPTATSGLSTTYINTHLTITIEDLDPTEVYDGDLHIEGNVYYESLGEADEMVVLANIDVDELVGGVIDDRNISRWSFGASNTSGNFDTYMRATLHHPIQGVTGVDTLTIPVKFKKYSGTGATDPVWVSAFFGYATLRKRS